MEEQIVVKEKTIEELNHELTVLKIGNDNLAKLLSESRSNHQNDIQAIGKALISEAEQRDFCTDYDDFIDELNDSLTRKLPIRMKEYVVRLSVTRTINTDVRVTVQARNEEEAAEMAENEDIDDMLPKSVAYWNEEDTQVEVEEVDEA